MLKLKQDSKPNKGGLMKPKPIGTSNKRKAGIGKPKPDNNGVLSKQKKEKTVGRRVEKNKPTQTDKFYTKVGNSKKTIFKKNTKKEENKIVDKERILGKEDLVSEVKNIKNENKIKKENAVSNIIIEDIPKTIIENVSKLPVEPTVAPIPVPIVELKVEPIIKSVRNNGDVNQNSFNREEKQSQELNKRTFLSRLDIKKEPLKRPKILSGYPKISELRCKQLTTSDIVSENKYAYSETYLTRKEYPTVDDYISLNSDISISKGKLDSTKSAPTSESGVVETIGIIPDLDFSVDSNLGTIELSLDIDGEDSLDFGKESLNNEEEETLELILEEEETLDLKLEDELSLTDLTLEEETNETSLDVDTIELSLDETPLNLEEPIELEPVALGPIAVETPLSLEPLEILEDYELGLEETSLLDDIPLEELNLVESKEELLILGEINLEEYDEDSLIGDEVEFKQLEIEDTNLVDDEMEDSLIDGMPETLTLLEPEDELDTEQEDVLEISIGDPIEDTDEMDLVKKYQTESPLTESPEEESPVLEKQTFGKKTNKQEYEEDLGLGLTYDINDLKIEDLTSTINKSFLDTKKEENITETDISQLLQYGESESLLSKSKNMDEALKYLK